MLLRLFALLGYLTYCQSQPFNNHTKKMDRLSEFVALLATSKPAPSLPARARDGHLAPEAVTTLFADAKVQLPVHCGPLCDLFFFFFFFTINNQKNCAHRPGKTKHEASRRSLPSAAWATWVAPCLFHPRWVCLVLCLPLFFVDQLTFAGVRRTARKPWMGRSATRWTLTSRHALPSKMHCCCCY